MARIICLANSRKNMNRCVAGMTPDGVWIRPVSVLPDGSIPWNMRQVAGQEPRVLDVLDIRLAATGPDFGHQPENRSLLDGKWTRAGVVNAAQIAVRCQKPRVLLHTYSDRVPEPMIAVMAPADRYSLQLIHVTNAEFYQRTSVHGKPQYRARFTYGYGRYDLVVTDPIAEGRLGKGETLKRRCIFTVSMGGPYRGEYFKFVAAVIEV